jgi:hypothetical protein
MIINQIKYSLNIGPNFKHCQLWNLQNYKNINSSEIKSGDLTHGYLHNQKWELKKDVLV